MATDAGPARHRDLVIPGVVVFAFLLILVRLWGLQIRRGPEFRNKSEGNFVHVKRLEHDRGEIVDRQGRVLVTNRPSVNVYLTPAFFPSANRTLRRLAAAVGLSERETTTVSQALTKVVSERGPPILLARDLSSGKARALRRAQSRLDLPLLAIPIIEAPHEQGEPRFAAYLNPEIFPSAGQVLQRLREVLSLSPRAFRALDKRVRKVRGLERYLDILVRRDVGPRVEEALSLDILIGRLPGVSVEHASARDYRFGPLAAHLLGYVNELSQSELENKRELGYRLGDVIGRRGVERTYEDELRGSDGRETIVVDSRGRSQGSDFAAQLKDQVGVYEAPEAGNRIVLALDLDLQRAAEQAFDGQAGAVVVMEVNSGRLLAVTSTPSFDPSKVSGHFDPREKKRLDGLQALRPWRYRAIQDHFAPGSTFKVVTALAALRAEKTNAHEAISCGGAFYLGRRRFRCWKEVGHGPVDLHGSIAHSCDVYYYTMGARLGLDPIAELGLELGFGSATGIPIEGESKGILPTRVWYRKNRPEGYTLGAAVNASIGQGAVTVTPIQLAVSYAAIANGGAVYRPQLALRIETMDGKKVRHIRPEVLRRVRLPQAALDGVREGLRRVVNEPGGTAYRRRLKDLEVSGKTGTAQVAKLGERRLKTKDLPYKLRDHAWFAAFAPSDDPKVVVVVFNEHGGGGSSAAAPIAMRVVDAWHQKRKKAHQGKATSWPVD